MQAFIGLGSNLANPAQQIMSALEAIAELDNTSLINQSSLYSSPPMGPQDQPDYINAVAEIETQLAPHALLDALQSIELEQGRIRKRHWGERTIDLDILIYGDQLITDERLNVPHPGVAERAFVLYPLVEIAAECEIPALGNIQDLLKQCPRDGLQLLKSE